MEKKNTQVSFDKRCLISLDLDGTILNSQGHISEFTKKVIKKLVKKGHIVSINTARPFNSACKFYDELGLNTPIACHNGAFMFNPADPDFTSTNWCMSKEIVKEIVTDPEVMKYASKGIIDAEKRAYIIGRSDLPVKEARLAAEKLGIYTSEDISTLDKISEFHDTCFGLILYPKTPDTLMDLVNAIKTKVPTVVTSLWRIGEGKSIVKVSSPYCSKGVASQLISSYYGIPSTRCYAFGDGLDDSDMLLFAAHGFAMKNGNNEAQLKANFITYFTNDQDGVAKALNRIFKLGFKK